MNLTSELGKIPPQAIEVEEIVLGSILISSESILEVIDILPVDAFYKEQNRIVYSACVDLFKNNEPIDIITVTERIKKQGKLDECGGPYYITTLTSGVASSAHIDYHARLLYDKFVGREIIRLSAEAQTKAFSGDEDGYDIIDGLQNSLFKLLVSKKNSLHISVIQNKRLEQLTELSKLENKYTGVTSGFMNLDRLTSGWQSGDLIIIAARPSMGKTTISLEFIMNAAMNGYPVDFYSLEMTQTQIYDKVLSRKANIENSFIRSAKMKESEWERISNMSSEINKMPIYIDDTPSLSIVEFKAKAKKNKKKYNTKLIVVDYLQLMKSQDAFKTGGREREVADISSKLKATAKELDVPVIALSQLNRSVESRAGSKIPQLSDLRESGSIEQDADMVMFIHRPEYYKIEEDEDGASTVGRIDLIIAKHRNGVAGDLSLWKNKTWTEISEHNENNTYTDWTMPIRDE